MDMMWFLMFAHLVGDYALQTDAMACNKSASRTVLTLHVLIYVSVLAVTLAVYSHFTRAFSFLTIHTTAPLLVIFAIHWIQDDIKSRCFGESRQAYYIDQALHIGQLFLLRGWLG